MSEKQIISQTSAPNTVLSLKSDLHKLGVKKGDTLLVHASMKAIGWVSGGPQAVIQALMGAITEEGTLIFQTHSPTLSDPVEWENPPVPKEWHETIRETMPTFDPDKTPSTYLGVLPELFRKFPNVYRSYHPTFSISAWGKQADQITNQHDLAYPLSDTSPLGQAYQREAKILLLGVGYDSNTSFHLSEYRSAVRKEKTRGAPLMKDGHPHWTTYPDIDINDDPFEKIGASFEQEYSVTKGKVGRADCCLFPMKESVDFATQWLKSNL
ncbi:aminoglycoside N(3)-acetyltransferase [Halobacillus sp. BBL2006]|uniref:aminoglycoside N(3)-acetyltransferase n=1 Tax=Halobacillus sp. BBL2006 TaxID=1543706 RepID=UPI00054215F7|nr:AAC(3) family N-acetyltransferase [Halobacillus sp. BBL2006]KHE72140.1 aminoglycoside 3-N-acetyltransferase [Halobacillus sp. BBL2006]